MNMKTYADDILVASNEIDRLLVQLDEMKEQKDKIETELSSINYRFRSAKTRFSESEYRGLIKRQLQLKQMLKDVLAEMSPIRSEIRKWSALEIEAKAKVVIDAGHSDVTVDTTLKQKVIEIRNKYLSFSEDGTRINSMRLMASEIANDLTKLIHQSDK